MATLHAALEAILTLALLAGAIGVSHMAIEAVRMAHSAIHHKD